MSEMWQARFGVVDFPATVCPNVALCCIKISVVQVGNMFPIVNAVFVCTVCQHLYHLLKRLCLQESVSGFVGVVFAPDFFRLRDASFEKEV